jgi:hypothetical protein
MAQIACPIILMDMPHGLTVFHVMVKCGVLFEVQAEFLNNIQTSFGFKGLNDTDIYY